MSREEPCVKLGKVSFDGDTRDCLRLYSIKKMELKLIRPRSS